MEAGDVNFGSHHPPTPNILHVPMEEIDKIGKLDPIKISYNITIFLREPYRIYKNVASSFSHNPSLDLSSMGCIWNGSKISFCIFLFYNYKSFISS